jgi:hypothetical protein
MTRKVTDKKGRGGRKPKLFAETVSAALVKHGGNVSRVAQELCVARNSVYRFISERPRLLDIVEDSRANLIDEAETSLLAAVRRGEAWAVCFALKTVGKVRGYVERQEVTGAEGGPVIEIVLPGERDSGDT